VGDREGGKEREPRRTWNDRERERREKGWGRDEDRGRGELGAQTAIRCEPQEENWEPELDLEP